MSQKRQRRLQLFRTSGRLEHFVIDILGPLAKTIQDNRLTVKMTDVYSKSSQATPVPKTAAAHVATMVL